MCPSLLVLGVLSLVQAPHVQSTCAQVAPARRAGAWARSPGQDRAVLLIHGYRLHFRDRSVGRAELRPWQLPGSVLVRELARDSDVFAFAYGQDAAVQDIAEGSRLGEDVARLRKLGYREVVLLGYSAGGLVARRFVEDHPDAGVTKVVQVCAPNGGCPAAAFRGPKSQQPFLDSLTPKACRACLKERAGKAVPRGVQFVCVVGCGGTRGESDGLVPCDCQWTADLREQGIPAAPLKLMHREAVRTPRGARALAALVRTDQPRWPPDRVRREKQALLGP